jgi:RimJ/RimL family protein N-acetyltransferase
MSNRAFPWGFQKSLRAKKCFVAPMGGAEIVNQTEPIPASRPDPWPPANELYSVAAVYCPQPIMAPALVVESAGMAVVDASFWRNGLPHVVILRDLTESDLPILFEHQNDPEATRMAAFLSRDPSDRHAFMTHWKRILADPTVTVQAILWNGQVAGSIGSFLWDGKPQVTYWLGKAFWGNGIATLALTEFLCIVNTRPLYASAARDNAASTRVLEKCGFAIRGSAKAFAKTRGTEIEEVFFELV